MPVGFQEAEEAARALGFEEPAARALGREEPGARALGAIADLST